MKEPKFQHQKMYVAATAACTKDLKEFKYSFEGCLKDLLEDQLTGQYYAVRDVKEPVDIIVAGESKRDVIEGVKERIENEEVSEDLDLIEIDFFYTIKKMKK